MPSSNFITRIRSQTIFYFSLYVYYQFICNVITKALGLPAQKCKIQTSKTVQQLIVLFTRFDSIRSFSKKIDKYILKIHKL